jgi:transcription elongation factor GreB
MSKAFTKEDDRGAEEPALARRAPLPEGTPNYVTARGLALLEAELLALERERAQLSGEGDARRAAWLRLGAQIAELAARLASAVKVAPPAEGEEQVRFGAAVRIRREDGSEEVFRIVGVDEADPKRGCIAFVAPLARALLGKYAGDSVRFTSPRGAEELEITGVDYAGED